MVSMAETCGFGDRGYWGYIGIMENEMETTIVYWGYIWDNGKENGNYYSMLRLMVSV